jgi:tRNA threonylcarbamoyl adenosine modification protein YeaZ
LGILEAPKQWVYRFVMPIESQRSHSAVLIPQLLEGLSQANLSLEALRGLAVVTGPGSFTGLRAGITTVRGLAQYLPELKVLPVSAFSALLAAYEQQGLFPSLYADFKPKALLIDAKLGRYYACIYIYCERMGYSEQPVFLKPLDPQAPLNESVEHWQQTKQLPLDVILYVVSPSHTVETVSFTSATVQYYPALDGEILLEALGAVAQQAKPLDWQELEPHYGQAPNITIPSSKSP